MWKRLGIDFRSSEHFYENFSHVGGSQAMEVSLIVGFSLSNSTEHIFCFVKQLRATWSAVIKYISQTSTEYFFHFVSIITCPRNEIGVHSVIEKSTCLIISSFLKSYTPVILFMENPRCFQSLRSNSCQNNPHLIKVHVTVFAMAHLIQLKTEKGVSPCITHNTRKKK